MGLTTGRAPGSTRAQGAIAFAGFVALLLLVASMPLLLSPPVALSLSGPAVAPAEGNIEFRGRFTLAGFGMGGATVEVEMDGALASRLTTEPDGSFVVTLPGAEPGIHTLRAVAARDGYVEAQTRELSFHAVRAPAPPSGLRAQAEGADVVLSWEAPPADAGRLVQEFRVYRQAPGAPWEDVAVVGGDATSARLPAEAGARYAVASANVAGESVWAGPVRA